MGNPCFIGMTSQTSFIQFEDKSNTSADIQCVEVVLNESFENTLLSEKALAEVWLSPEEDEAWKDL